AIVLNKIDLLSPSDNLALGAIETDARVVAVFRVSCATGAGVEQLRRALFELVPPPSPIVEPELPEFLVYRPRPPARRAYRIYRTDRGFRVVGSPPDGAELERAL